MLDAIVAFTNKKARPIETVCQKFGLSESKLQAILKKATKEGYLVTMTAGYVYTQVPVMSEPKPRVPKEIVKPGRYHVAHLTDMHFGSKHCATQQMIEFLYLASDRGCKNVVCTGDILDGNKPVLIPDQKCHTWDAQVKLAKTTLKLAPKNMKFHAIDGNHDGYFSASVGMISGRLLQAEMINAGIDWKFLGVCKGEVNLHGAEWHLWHPHGGAGTRNAIRTIMNARVEAHPYGDILALGHFHKYTPLVTYPEGIYCIAGGTFQEKHSEFANRITRPWDIGGAIVSYTWDGVRACEISSEFFHA